MEPYMNRSEEMLKQTINCKDEIFCSLINGLEITQNIKELFFT